MVSIVLVQLREEGEGGSFKGGVRNDKGLTTGQPSRSKCGARGLCMSVWSKEKQSDRPQPAQIQILGWLIRAMLQRA